MPDPDRDDSSPRYLPWAAALLATLAAVAVRWIFDPLFGDRYALFLLYPAIAFSVWLGGIGPAVLSLVLGYLVCNYLFLEPRFVLTLPTRDVAALPAYLVSAGAVVALGAGLRTARRRVSEEKQRLSDLVATIKDHFVQLDHGWRYVYVNDRLLETTGRPASDFIGKVIWDSFPGLVGTDFERAALRTMYDKTPERVEFFYEKTGRWLEARFYPSADGVTLLSHDVTDQRLAEIELAERAGELSALYLFSDRLQHAVSLEQVYHAALDAIVGALGCQRASIRLFDAGGVMQFVAWRGLSDGYRTAVAGHSPWTRDAVDPRPLWVPDVTAAQDMDDALKERIAGEGIRALGFIPLLLGGKLIGTFMVYYDRPHPERGREIELALTLARQLAFAIDRQQAEAERRRTEEALREGEERFRIATETGKVGVWDWDIISNKVTWSDSLFAMHGVRREDFKGTVEAFAELVHPEDAAFVNRAIQRTLAGESDYEVEFRIVRPDGGIRWLYTEATALWKDEKPHRMIGATVDITGQKLSEQALIEANQRKDQFLATLAHELRNPLAPLSNMLEILKRSGTDPILHADARETMERQLAHLVRLVDDLLDVARVTRGKLELRKERVELGAVIHQAMDTIQPQLTAFGHRVNVSLPTGPVYLDADPVRLTQVFGNLLNNACKYTPPGGQISLSGRREDGEIVISVTDTGFGIPPEMLSRVFDLFTQVDGSLERSHGGLGIGLTLVRQLVEMHGGRIEASSGGPGRGSEFTVRLPLPASANEPAPPEVIISPVASSCRILVVDDNQDGADSLAIILRMAGHETAIARDGITALKEAEHFQPDVAILDLGLPGLNGFDTCRRMRQEPWGSGMTIIALTGWGQDEYRRRSDEAGFDAHLVKPVNHAALMRLINSRRPRAAETAPR